MYLVVSKKNYIRRVKKYMSIVQQKRTEIIVTQIKYLLRLNYYNKFISICYLNLNWMATIDTVKWYHYHYTWE